LTNNRNQPGTNDRRMTGSPRRDGQRRSGTDSRLTKGATAHPTRGLKRLCIALNRSRSPRESPPGLACGAKPIGK